MKSLKKYYNPALFAILTICISSCKKILDVAPPKNQIVTSQVFADDASATAAVSGIYIIMANNVFSPYLGNGGLSVYTGITGDELNTSINYGDILQFSQDAVSKLNNASNDRYLWGAGYSLIYQANAVIEGLTASTTVSTATKNQLLGEAKFIRAFLYFNLSNLYGNVPLATTTSFQTNADLPRASQAAIYQQEVSDLQQAQNLLTSNYVTNGHNRPNKYTATALLAKVYLYNKQWAKADSASTVVINSGAYSLEQNLNNVCLTGSKEAIWQLAPIVPYIDTFEGFNYVPYPAGTTIPNYPISNTLLAAFEPGDQRYKNWLASDTVGGTVYFYPYKYQLWADINNAQLESLTVLRLAEQYLIRAEAEAENKDVNDAIADLNVIRTRAGLSSYSGATDATSVLNAIMHERRIEMFCEWGNRWFDLKRTGTINTVLSAELGTKWPADGHAALYPIPQQEINADPLLTQNPGY